MDTLEPFVRAAMTVSSTALRTASTRKPISVESTKVSALTRHSIFGPLILATKAVFSAKEKPNWLTLTV
jgi:hypothetical protein